MGHRVILPSCLLCVAGEKSAKKVLVCIPSEAANALASSSQDTISTAVTRQDSISDQPQVFNLQLDSIPLFADCRLQKVLESYVLFQKRMFFCNDEFSI